MAIELQQRSVYLVVIESTLFAIIFVCTVVGNLMIMVVIYKNKSLQTVPSCFVLSLAVSDLTMALFSEPFCFVVLAVSKWPFGFAMCQFNGYLVLSVVCASIQTMAWTAVNRYYRVVKTSQYGRVFTARILKFILASIWIIALLCPCPYFLAGNKFIFIPAKFFCFQHVNSKLFTAFLLIVFVGFPSCVIFFCYFQIFRTVRNHNRDLYQSNSRVNVEEIKITRTLFVIVVMFMLCWTPILVVDLIDTFKGKWSLNRPIYTTYSFLGVISSMVNPLCYGIMNPQFRKGYFKVFTRLFCYKRVSRISQNEMNLSNVTGEVSTQTKKIKPKIHSVLVLKK